MDAHSSLKTLILCSLALVGAFGTVQAGESEPAHPAPAATRIDYAMPLASRGVLDRHAQDAQPGASYAFTYERLRRGLVNALAASELSLRAAPSTARSDMRQSAALTERPRRAGVTSFLPIPMDDGGLFMEIEIKY